jgi:dihydrodipicolinate synthase/N-acetylneuraminate lyase
VYGYTIPSHTHRELEPALLERLIGDGLAGLKDSTKSPARHRDYAAAVRAADAPFALFTGSAGLVLEALGEGSAGAVLALANLHPEPCVALVRAVRDGRDDEAERAQAEMAEHDAALKAAGPIPTLKRGVAERLAERGAAYGATVRGPLAPVATVAAG